MAENRLWNTIRDWGQGALDKRDEREEQRAAQQAAPVSQMPAYQDNSVVQITSQAAPGRMGSGLYQYNTGVRSTKDNTGFSSNHEWEQQYQYARQLGLSRDQAFQQLANGTRWKEIALGENGRPIVSYETGFRSTKGNTGFASEEEFQQQYQLATASGLSREEAFKALANGTRWREQAEDLWDNREYQQSVDDRSFLSKAFGAMTWLPSLVGDMDKVAARYQDTQDDTFWGQSIANFKLGLLQQRAALLTGRALMKGDEDMYNQALEFTKLAEEYAERNKIALDDENAVATWLSKDIAQYLPQLMMQTESSALPTALFGGIGALLGGPAGLTAGLKAGGVAGSTAYSYATMLGNAFTDLTTDGVDPTVAVKLAKDEALISSIIEGADTAKDLFLGVYSSLGFGEKAFDLSSDLASRLLKGIKGWAGNVGEEGLEEILQEIVTQANASRAARGDTSGGVLGLLRECGYIAAQRGIELGDHFFNGAEWSDALKELGAAGRGGAVVGAVMGGLGTTHSIINETRQVNAMNRGFDQMASDPDHKVTTIDGKQVKTTEISDEELARQLRNAEGLKHQDAVDILQAERERRNAAAAAKTQSESMWGDDEETSESAPEAAAEAAPAEAAPVEATTETKTEAPAAPGETTAESQAAPSAPNEAAASASAVPGTPTDQVRTMLSQPLNRSQANKIINDPELRAAYEQITGEKLPSSKSEAAKAVMARSQNQAATIASNPAPVYDSNGQPITNNTKGAVPNDSNRGDGNTNPGIPAAQAGAEDSGAAVGGVRSGTVSPVGQEQSGNSGVDSQNERRRDGVSQNEESSSGNPEAGQENRGSESVQESVSGENPEGEQASSASNGTGTGQDVSSEEAVKKKSEKEKKAERRHHATQRHFKFTRLLENPVKNIENGSADNYYNFVVKAVGKALGSENFAKALIAKYALAYDTVVACRRYAADNMTNTQKRAFLNAVAADIFFTDFLNDEIDAQFLADNVGITTETAEKRMEGFDKCLLDAMVEENILDSKYNVKIDIAERADAKRVSRSGKNNLTSVLAEGQKVGKSQTVDINGKFTQMEGDSLLRHEGIEGRKIFQRDNRYIVVDAKNNVIGDTKDLSTAIAKANGSASTVEQLSIQLGDASLIKSDSTGALELDQEAAFSNQNNLTTVGRSEATDLVNAQYETDGRRKIDTSILDIELTKPEFENMTEDDILHSYNNLTSQIRSLIVGSNKGIHDVKGMKNKPGITTKAGVTYRFFGMTSNGAKDLRVKMVREEVYDKLRKASLSGLTPEQIDEFNVAKYITASSSIFSPSNADTGVKIKDCIILPDVYNLLQSVTRDFMMLDKQIDSEGIHDMYKATLVAKGMDDTAADAEAKRLTKEFIKKGKVGYTQELISDILLNVTDGTGFIISKDGKSFQMRSLGGFKGQLVAFDFFSFLKDHVPIDETNSGGYKWYGEDGKLVGGIRRDAKDGGKIFLCDRWGEWQPIDGKKAVLFDSCVKFAGKFESFGDLIGKNIGDEKSPRMVGDEDLRRIPRENVYGAHPDAGYLEGYETFGLSQFLRGQRNFSDDLIASVMDEKIDKVMEHIRNSPTAAAKLFGVDLNSKTPPSSSDNKALVIWDAWRHGKDFLRETPEGVGWLKEMMGKVTQDYQAGRMAFENGTANYQWIDPDVVGLFNAMTAVATEGQGRSLGGLFVNGYSGLQNGEILNMNLKEGDTAIGRFPTLAGRGVQIRTNIRNQIYNEMVEKYGLDPDNIYISVNDTLSKYLDNDYDGDAVMSFQGALMELVKDARSKSNNKYIDFAHAKAKKQDVTKADVILGAVEAYIEASKKFNIGKFDTMLERLYAIPDEDLERAAKAYGKEHGMNLDKESFISLLEARFGVAYVLAIDYAKTGRTYEEFYNLVNETNEMIYKIAETNGYITRPQNESYLKMQKEAERTGQRLVNATWQFHKKQEKRDKWWGAKEQNRQSRGNNALAALVLNDRVPKKEIANIAGNNVRSWKATFENFLGSLDKRQRMEGRDIRQNIYARAMSIDPAYFGGLDPEIFHAVATKYSEIVTAELDSKKFKKEADIIREKKRLIYEEIQKKLGLNNRQFTDLMLYVLGPRSGNTAMILDFDQSVIDPSNTQQSTKQIIGENLRLQNDFELIQKGLSSTEDSMRNIDSAMEATEEKIAKLQKEMKNTSANIFMRASNVVNAVKSKIGQVENRLEKLRNKSRGRMSSEDIQETKDLMNSARRELESLRRQLASAEASAFDYPELEREIADALKPLEAELREALWNMDRLEKANQLLENYYSRNVEQLEIANEKAEAQYAKEQTGFEDVTAEGIAEALGVAGSKPNGQTEQTQASNNGNSDETPPSAPGGGGEPESAPTESGESASEESAEEQPKQAPEQGGPPQPPELPEPPKGPENTAQPEEAASEEAKIEEAEKPSQPNFVLDKTKKTAKRITRFTEKFEASFGDGKNLGRGDRSVIRFGKVVSRFAEGKATIAEVTSAYRNLNGTQYYDETPGALITEKFDELNDLYEDSGLADGKTPSPDDLAKLSRVADEALSAFVARGKLIEQVNRINNSLAEQAKNQKPAAKLAGKIAAALGSWQVNAPTFFKMLSSYQQNSTGYQMADQIYRAVEQEQRYVVNALNELKDVSQMKGYSDLISGKKKIQIKALGIEMKAIDAVNLLRTLDTLENTKGSTSSALSFVDSDGNKHSLYSKSNHSLSGDVQSELTRLFEGEDADPIFAEYYKAASNVFATFTKDIETVTKNVNGFSPEMMNPGWYSPVIWGENAEAAENFNTLESELKGAPGYTMRRSADSHGTLYIGSMQDVLSSYITRMSEYLSYAELRAELAAMNQNVENRGSDTLATITGNALGKDYARFINNYIKDMTMTKAQDPTLLSSLRNLMQKGVLIGSPSVMMKQSASYWNAAPIISMESLVKARGLRGIQKNAGVGKSAALDYRSMTGKFDPTVSELFSNNNTFADKLAAKSKAFNLFKNGIGLIDRRTVNNIYIAACYDVEKRGLKRGTAEFDSAVDELFTRAVTVSQPMFQKALRAENARTSNELVRMLSMFRTQQTQNYNRVVTALGEYAATKDMAHKKVLQGTIKGQLTSAVSLAVMTGIADMLLHKLKKYRDDEDKEKIDPGKVASRMALNSIEALAGTYWFGSELSKIAIDVLSGGETNEFYSPSFGALSTITDSISALKDFAAEPSIAGAKKFVGYASQLGGIPLNNLYNLLNSVVMYAKDMAGTNPEYYDDILKYIDNSRKLDNRFARAAVSGDVEKTNTLFNAMARQYGDKADDQVRSVVRNQYGQGNMSANQAANLLIQYGELDSDKAVQRVARWDFMAEYPQYEDMSESAVADWNNYLKPAGIPAGTWYSINNWFNSTNSIKDANGKVVTSKQELVIDYLSELDMSSAQKDALWLAFGYKTTTAAYRTRPWR